MITLLTGDNSYEIEQHVARLVAAFQGEVERIDGSELEIRNLADIVSGATLFADTRLVIMKGLSDNKVIWPIFGEWLSRISDDVHVVLVDTKPDKRTVAYRELKKVADVYEYTTWGERDSAKAEQWLQAEAIRIGLTIDRSLISRVVRRVGTDQWQLLGALEKLSLLPTISADSIDDTIDANPTENVFNILDAALSGNSAKVSGMIKTLQLFEDPYRLFALLGSQVFQLAAVASSGPDDSPSKDFGIHPYAMGKLEKASRTRTRGQIKKIVNALAAADDDMKQSRGEPWLLIERALMTIANIK